ncbi:Putative E3 ubiquitin-protein ligase HERC1, partial [Durusdinium trenchii]
MLDSSGVQDQLKNVVQISACYFPFAALLKDGSIVTWGHAACGGDSSGWQDQLMDVQEICASTGNVQRMVASGFAFAAILQDGLVITWGRPEFGGDSSKVRDELRSVQQICATSGAFVALLADGSLISWGHPDLGGDSTEVQEELRRLQGPASHDFEVQAVRM